MNLLLTQNPTLGTVAHDHHHAWTFQDGRFQSSEGAGWRRIQEVSWMWYSFAGSSQL